MRANWGVWAAALLGACGAMAQADVVPATTATALDGTQVSFPAKGGARPLLLVVGFSHKSNKQMGAWNARLKSGGVTADAEYYELAELQSAPRLVRPMILHGMRGEVPKQDQSRMAPLYQEEARWKEVARYSEADDAYVVVADPTGRVVGVTHGAVTDEKYREVVKELAAAGEKK